MHYTVEYKDSVVILDLKNKTIESEISAELKAKLLVLAQPDIEALIVDMSKVDAVDSSGLGALLLANRQLRENAIPVILVGVKGFVKSLMSMTKIDEVFEFFSTIDEALQALEKEE